MGQKAAIKLHCHPLKQPFLLSSDKYADLSEPLPNPIPPLPLLPPPPQPPRPFNQLLLALTSYVSEVLVVINTAEEN